MPVSPRGDRALTALLVAAAALVTALLQPTVTVSQTVFRHLLVFDITQSMNVVDEPAGRLAPTRLDRARASALAAMAQMPCGSRVGVGLFTGHRTLVLFAPAEVCAHYGDIAATVEAIDWRMAWEARSEVAKGVHSALLAAKAVGEGTSVVFMTDGHEAPPLSPALRPRFRGTVGEVRGALAGVGGNTLTPIPKLDAQGRRRGFWRREDVLQVDTVSLGRAGSGSLGDSPDAEDQVTLRRRIAAGTEHLSSLKEDYLQALARGLDLEYRRVRGVADMRRLLEHPRLGVRRPASLPLAPALAVLALLLVLAVYADGAWRASGRAGDRARGQGLRVLT